MDKKMIQDGNGLLVPQYFNPDDDVFEVIQGKDGQPIGGAAEWAVSDKSAANEAGALEKAAVAGSRHYISMIAVGVTAADSANAAAITLKDDETTIFEINLKSESAEGDVVIYQFEKPLAISAGKKATLGCAAAGEGCITVLNMSGYTVKTSV